MGKSIAYINQIENNSPENLKNGFAEKYGKAIEDELMSRIEKDVKEVFRLL